MSGIQMALLGTGGVRINIDTLLVSETGAAPVTASYSLQNDGQIVYTNQLGTEFWITPQVGMGDYEVFATLDSGTLSSGTTGSWLNLGTTRTWARSSGGGLLTAVITLQIRPTGGSVLDTATITLEADGL